VGLIQVSGHRAEVSPNSHRASYLAEQVVRGQATVLGVMKQSNERSIEEAESRFTAESGSGTHLFKAIRSTTADGRTSQGSPRSACSTI
jgi:hypothetical protein